MRTFKGRVIIPGKLEGEALVSQTDFNTLASFIKGLIANKKEVTCSDQDNRSIHGEIMTGKILCLPKTIGSTTGGLVFQSAIDKGMAPKALLFSEHIDTLAASGILMANIWLDKKIITIDQLGDDFLQAVKTGEKVMIDEDGVVTIEE